MDYSAADPQIQGHVSIFREENYMVGFILATAKTIAATATWHSQGESTVGKTLSSENHAERVLYRANARKGKAFCFIGDAFPCPECATFFENLSRYNQAVSCFVVTETGNYAADFLGPSYNTFLARNRLHFPQVVFFFNGQRSLGGFVSALQVADVWNPATNSFDQRHKDFLRAVNSENCMYPSPDFPRIGSYLESRQDKLTDAKYQNPGHTVRSVITPYPQYR